MTEGQATELNGCPGEQDSGFDLISSDNGSWSDRHTTEGRSRTDNMAFPQSILTSKAVRELAPQWLLDRWGRAQASPLGRRLAHGVLWSVAGAFSGKGLALVTSIITARFLGKAGFGEFGIIQSTIIMFATFATFGMGVTATKHVAEFRQTDPERAGRIIGLSSLISWLSGLVIGLALVLFAPWLAGHTLAAPHLTGALRLAAICLLFSVVNEAQMGTLSGFEAFKKRSTTQFVAGLAGLPLALAGVYWWGLIGAVWGLAAGQGLQVFLNFLALRQEARHAGVPISCRLSRGEFAVFWGFSLPTLFGAAVYVPAMWVANAIMVNVPNGYAEMGIFNAADRWRTAIRFLPLLLSGVSLPMLSSLQGKANRQKYNQVLVSNVKLSFGLAIVAAVPIALLSYWIMASYGHGFAEGQWVLVSLVSVSVITATSWTLGNGLTSEGRVWVMFFLNLTWASVLLLSSWLLRFRGAQGLAYAYLVAESVRLACMWVVMKNRVR
jgi:O-antigen/teichoic acid export membrane protein